MDRRILLGLLGGALVLAALGSAGVGALPLGPEKIGSILGSLFGLPGDHTSAEAGVFLQIRLPRVVFGLLTGGILGVTGAVLQGFFRNNLADPGLLGVSSGASVAVGILAVLLPGVRGLLGPWAFPTVAFLGSLAAAFFVGRLGGTSHRSSTGTLLLAGLAVSALGGAGTGLLLSLADDGALRDLTFWSLGSLGGITWGSLGVAAPFILVPLGVLPWVSRHLDSLLLGEREAGHLGVPLPALRWTILGMTASGVGACTAFAGGIGFVGLLAPHLARALGGPLHRWALPFSGLIGALLTLGADLAARTLVAPSELPLGVVLAFLGAPFLLGKLKTTREDRG